MRKECKCRENRVAIDYDHWSDSYTCNNCKGWIDARMDKLYKDLFKEIVIDVRAEYIQAYKKFVKGN